MATAEKTKRHQTLQAAAAAEETHRIARDTLQRQVATLDQQLEQARTERAGIEEQLQELHAIELATGQRSPKVETLRARMRELEDDVTHWSEVRAIANRKLQGKATAAHTAAYQDRMSAARAFQREPCELQLERLNVLFAEVEQVWGEAGAEAKRLVDAGDDWGRFQLQNMQHNLNTSGFTNENGQFLIRMPRYEAE